ncbi:C1q-related factor-like [Mercenaria mercenaria]|uniref:C1q-related factor-like n=1 Tax=Mercenaria mercenaria TaxID=6596 RepID=UPI00234F374C|nr:C1q-related factor-like [Mercenaria mercenaria]
MFEFLLIICVTIFGMTTAETESEFQTALLKRLEATESLVRDLLQEVNKVKSQDKIQRSQIAHMEKQLRAQQQRSSQLETLMRSFKVSGKEESSDKTDWSPVLPSKKHSLPTDNGSSMQRIRRVENETPVAFFAKMVNHLEHGGVHQTVIFDSVVTNVGNAYYSHIGTFIAPLPGTYVFSTTLVSRHFNGAHAQFVKNGTALTTMYVSAGQTGDDTTSQTIVLQLEKGEDVSVQNLDSDKSFYGDSHSIFSGFLLEEDYSSSVIVGK